MPRQYYVPIRVPVIVSASVTTSSNSGNLRTLFNSAVGNPIPLCDVLTLFLDVTGNAQTTTTGATFRVYIDSSVDGGTTWYPAISFAGVSTSTDIQKWDGRMIGVGVSETASLIRVGTTVSTASASTVSTVLSGDQRVRWEFTPSATATTASFAIWALCLNTATYAS